VGGMVESSDAQMAQYAGDLLINPLIYSELCYGAASAGEVDQLVAKLGFQYEELPKQALYRAAQAYRAYRKLGGTKGLLHLQEGDKGTTGRR